MKLSDVIGDLPVREEPAPRHSCSELADPPITPEEARTVDLARDTTVCRWHHGQHTHLNAEGRVYFCAIGKQLFRHSKLLSDFLKPLPYPKGR